ncbi:protein O-mannosyl-transferase family [Nibribacter koreensis]
MLLTKPDAQTKTIIGKTYPEILFGRRQFVPLLLGMAIIAVGFMCMALDPTPQGYGFLGLTLGPLLVVIGLMLPFFGIFRDNRPKTEGQILPKQTEEEQNAWKSFHRWNLLVGWAVGLVALTVYVLTLEPSTSFWDTGEFIAAAYKLQVPHPPGAPLFLLIGRLFTLLSFGDVTQVAWCMNLLSALSSAGTVLFLFWSITLVAKRLLPISPEGPTKAQQALLLASATVGALGFAFTDSFWFSAVEAEVYAMSSFFTAIVFWAALMWQAKAHTPQADRWLLFLAYLVGLSIGVHLLNLVAIPAIALLVYLQRNKPTKRGIFISLLIGGAIVLVVMEGVITGLPTLAGSFEVFFVNTFSLPYGSGAVLFLVLLAMALVLGLRWAKQHGKAILHTSLVAFILILTGYSSYLMVPIRSGFNTPIDENNPENLLSFVSYLKREQYGSRPLLYGPQFNAQSQNYDKTGAVYAPQNGKYEVIDTKFETTYLAQDKVLLPRLYSPEPSHLRAYQQWVNVEAGQKPNFGQNLTFLWNYQLGHMYWRYFGWNFIGREHDTQHAGVLWPWEQKHDVPAPLSVSKARNQFYLLPLLLGVFGLFSQFKCKTADAWTVLLLFFFTGVAIVVYLNQPPVEPRERDYTFAGSYYAFSIWMGLGVLAIAEGLRKVIQSDVTRAVAATLLALSVPAILLAKGWDDHDRSGRSHAMDNARNLLSSVAPNAILFTNGDNDTFPLWYAQEVEGFRTDVRVLVLPYLNTDWYIEQLKKQMNASKPLETTLEMPQYAFSNNNYLPFVANPSVQESGMDLRQYLTLLQQNHPALQVQTQDGRTLNTLPTKRLQLAVNVQAVLQNQTVSAERMAQVANVMQWELQTDALEKKHLVILDILASNNWERPIYFSTSGGETTELGLQPFLQLEGMALRVVPARNPDPEAEAYVDRDRTSQSLLQKSRFTGLQNPDNIYEDNFTTQVVPIYRGNFAKLATAYLENNELAKARAVLQKCLTALPDKGAPHNFESASLVLPLTQAGMQKEASDLTNLLSRRFDQLLTYYSTQPPYYDRERQLNLYGLQLLTQAAYSAKMPQAKQLEALFNKHYVLIKN